MVSRSRSKLLQDIKLLQQLIPAAEYDLYIKQAKQKNLVYVSQHSFLPAMDEKSPKSLNDVELNVLSMSKRRYIDNIFTPVVVEKQVHILKDAKGESAEAAVARWTQRIKKTQDSEQLKAVIEQINRRKRSSSGSKKDKKKPFLKKILGL